MKLPALQAISPVYHREQEDVRCPKCAQPYSVKIMNNGYPHDDSIPCVRCHETITIKPETIWRTD